MTLIGSGFSSLTPLTFARGRYGDVYGVNGQQRGFRWDTATGSVEQLGISAPTNKPSISVSYTDPLYDIMQIDVVDGGYGYRRTPTVRVGGGGTTVFNVESDSSHAAASEIYVPLPASSHGLANGQAIQFESISGVRGLYRHRVYYAIVVNADTFQVALTPNGAAVSFTLTEAFLTGTVRVPASTAAVARATMQNGRVISVDLQRYGIGYAAPPAVTCDAPDLPAPDAGGAVLTATLSLVQDGDMFWQGVSAVSVSHGGSGYTGRPQIQFTGGNGGGAYAEAQVNGSGEITSVTVLNGGQYETAPTVTAVSDWSEKPRAASLSPALRAGIQGKYWCAIRYIDDTVEAKGGPIPSSISELTEVEVTDPARSFSWTINTSGVEARVHRVELWRTTADQVTTLYRVADISKSTGSYTDSLTDAALSNPDRVGFAAMPIVLPNGQANARRFNPPPQNKSVVAMFQDRAWYAVDVPGRKFNGSSDSTVGEPNALYFSEADEPESVPEFNQLIIQENVKGQDRITALMPFGGGMVVFQERHAYRLSFASQPLIDANISLIGQRGCLNQRCWDVYDNVAYVVDSMGMYMLDGTNAVPLSDSVDTYWTDNVIHFASSKWFFVRVDPVTRIARFFFSTSAGRPDRALCFHPLTKAWWEERYAQTFAAMECMTTGGRQAMIVGGAAGAFYRFDSGNRDIDSAAQNIPIACSYRTGFFPFVNEASRSVRVLFKPTATDCSLGLALHYNGSATARAAAVRTDRGTGFTTDAAQNATLNLKLTRSALGDATGYAVASYVGRMDDKSAGGDRHLSVGISLARPDTEGVTIYGLGIEGIGS